MSLRMNTLEQSNMNIPTTPMNAQTSTKFPRKCVTHRASALPGSPICTPWKRTKEHPGLIGKVTWHSKQEVAAERAAKVAKKKEETEKRAKAKERLADVELETAAVEHTWKKKVVRHLPSINDPDSSTGADFD